MNHVDRQHAKYGSSRIHRVRACSGYVALAARLPRVASVAADEGTHAHEMLALSLMGIGVKQDCTKDEWRGIEMVHDFLTSIYISHGPHIVCYVEERVVFPQDVVPEDDAAGIADLMVLDHLAQEAWSIEYKFGHVYVPEKRNPQLLFNAVARWWRQPITKLNLVVIQPNCHMGEAVRVDVVGPVEMAEFQASTEDAIRNAERYAQHWADPVMTPGPHCRFCECELTCPARERQAVQVVDPQASRIEHMEGATLPPVAELTMDRLAYIMRHKDAMREFLNAAEKEAHRRAMEGQHVPEHKLVEALARRSFPEDVDGTAAALAALSGYVLEPDAFTERSLIGVTKAEALLTEIAAKYAPKGSQRQAVKEMKERLAFLTPRASSGNLVLASMSDSRPAVKNRVASGFAGINIPIP
jgi:hypothetical protein